MKKIRKLKNSNEAVAGVIVAVLMIGLILSIIAFIQAVYVPQWMEEKEAEHMEEVGNQFSQLKFAVDTLSVTRQKNSPISCSITLGSKEMPFLYSEKSYGSLEILPNDCKIEIIDNFGTSFEFNLGSIRYDSDNYYYLDQSYIFEAGALLLVQDEDNVISIQPAISIVDQKDLFFNFVKFSGIGDKTSASGYGTYPLQAKFFDSEDLIINSVQQINLNTSYIDAWKGYFEDLFAKSDLRFRIEENLYGDCIIITFEDIFPDLNLKVNEISVQISPGWIE